MRTEKLSRLALLATAFVALAGCRTLLGPTQPRPGRVHVSALHASFHDNGRGELDWVMEVTNERGEAGRATLLYWEAALNQRRFATGVSEVRENLPAKGNGVVRVTLPFTYEGFGFSPDATSVHLEVRGELEVERGGSAERLSFVERQKVSVQGAPDLNNEL